MPWKTAVAEVTFHQLETPKTQPFTVTELPSKKWYLFPMFSPGMRRKHSGISRHRFPVRKKSPIQGARKGVDHLKEILGKNWKRRERVFSKVGDLNHGRFLFFRVGGYLCPLYIYMGVSLNGGNLKWMVYNGKPYWNGWFAGTIILGNPHMDRKGKYKLKAVCVCVICLYLWFMKNRRVPLRCPHRK